MHMVNLSDKVRETLNEFLEQSNFENAGGVITDLDGTALHEDQGRIYIPKPVELGFKQLHDRGRPFVLNSLRFPMSVLRTFGRDWYGISNALIPAITLNGALLGYVTQDAEGAMSFEEIAAFPLSSEQIDQVLNSVEQLLRGGDKEILLFYYPRDWRAGEVIWTPVAEQVLPVMEKYVSASSVTAVEIGKLRDQLHGEDVCMMFLLLNMGKERLMAYQHTRRDNFFTRQGVDKLFGAERMAEFLHFTLRASIGSGDTEMDRFLNGVGLAIVVGGEALPFQGGHGTLRLRDSFELGDFLFQVADMLGRRK
jgi:hydroxymethylpyrimidine pyrophosphatase-like HAD family hydrolase